MTGILISTFFVSLAGVSFMLGYKAWVLADAAHHTPSQHRLYREFSIKASEYYRVGQKIGRRTMLVTHTYILSLIVAALRVAIKGLIEVHARLQKRLSSVTDLVKGRMRPASTSGEASVYLKDIARHKEEARIGK